MTISTGPTSLRLFLCVGLLALACGRSDLDLAPVDNLPVTTGAAGTSGAAGTGTTGAAGTVGTAGTTGTAGRTGAAGRMGVAGMTGTAGTTGAAGMRVMPTGAAGMSGPGMPGGPGMPPPNRIPCGTTTCTAGMQACCVRVQNGMPTAMCIAAGETCDAGASFGCSNTASCGPGAVCCVSTLNLSTTCEAPAACLRTPGIILCGADADCPGLLPNCCGPGNLKTCRVRACRGNGRGPGR
jgi:pilus assembly protein FimV